MAVPSRTALTAIGTVVGFAGSTSAASMIFGLSFESCRALHKLDGPPRGKVHLAGHAVELDPGLCKVGDLANCLRIAFCRDDDLSLAEKTTYQVPAL